MAVDTYQKIKEKTKGKADRSKIKTQKVNFKKKEKNTNNIVEEREGVPKIKALKTSEQENLEEITNSLQEIKRAKNNSEINLSVNKIIKSLNTNKITSEKQNNQLSTNLEIINKIKQRKNTIDNKNIIEQIYNTCSKENISVNNPEKMQELLNLANKLEITDTQPKVIPYYDYQQKLSAERLLPTETKGITTKVQSEIIPQPIKHTLPWKNKKDSFMVYRLKRDIVKDHESGRPAIYLGFDEEKGQHKLISGTSNSSKSKNQILELDLSTKTYFNPENIILINDAEIDKVLDDFWRRDFKSNKPIDFLNFLPPKQLEQFKQSIDSQEKLEASENTAIDPMNEYLDNSQNQDRQLSAQDAQNNSLTSCKKPLTNWLTTKKQISELEVSDDVLKQPNKVSNKKQLLPLRETASMKECSFKQPVLASYNSGDSVKVAKLVQKVQEEEIQKNSRKNNSKTQKCSLIL
ncbi:hypothetical protein [Spiroplasma endosymbiont of Nebria brevicollis]|uniref:hypothetical protein n=1 Tax=Spiroplasma endosymbiont of Nebria brevicollis TaxID=3066284 RepID=UPI00313AB264